MVRGESSVQSTELATGSLTHVKYQHKGFTAALVDGFPLSLSVFAYGIAYGALANSTNHLTITETLLMSLVVFAGASQFAILDLLHQGALMWTIVISTFLINARQILYGFTLGRVTKKIAKRKLLFLAHGITDESYSISIVQSERGFLTVKYLAGAGMAVYVPWIVSSILGYIAGGWIGDPTRLGMDFAFIGAFLGLLFAQIHSKSHLLAAGLAALTATLAYLWLGTSAAVLAGACTAFSVGVMKK
jgi:4-azaleucine resistance transporter AzlC